MLVYCSVDASTHRYGLKFGEEEAWHGREEEDLHQASTPILMEDRLGLDDRVLCFVAAVFVTRGRVITPRRDLVSGTLSVYLRMLQFYVMTDFYTCTSAGVDVGWVPPLPTAGRNDPDPYKVCPD